MQSISWFVNREVVRWGFRTDRERRKVGARLQRALASKDLDYEDLAPTLESECVTPCINGDCRAYWDANLIFKGNNLRLLANVLACTFLHRHPSKFDRVVGIARSGLGFASLVSLATNKSMSILLPDNILNLNPQPAMSERWLLIDDAYQSGYCLEAMWSQMTGLQCPPRPEDVFVLFKSRGEDGEEIKSFDLTNRMRAARAKVGTILQYDYDQQTGRPLFESHGRQKVGVSVTNGILDVLRDRIDAATTAPFDIDRARRLIVQDGFSKVALLLDYPDIVLAIGNQIRLKSSIGGPPLAFLIGSAKAIPFVVAACLCIMQRGESAPLMVLMEENGALAYDEMLLQAVRENKGNRRVVFVDTVRKGGRTFLAAKRGIDKFNRTYVQFQVDFEPGVIISNVADWKVGSDPIASQTIL